MEVQLSKAVDRAIRTHGEETYPYECCGFLLGKADESIRKVDGIYRQENQIDSSRETRYLIRPEAYKNAEKQAKETGQELVGIYHSHPDHPSRPSQYDLDHAWPWYAYLILSVQSGKADSLEAWHMREDRSAFDEVILHVADDEHLTINKGE